MSKNQQKISEAETRERYITPPLKEAGWEENGAIIRHEWPITSGKIQPSGHRATPKIADYVLFYKERPLAVVEAKRYDKSELDGITQAREYSEMLQAPFAFSTNGRRWWCQNNLNGKSGAFTRSFYTPEEMWQEMFPHKDYWREAFAKIPFNLGGNKDYKIRYYQQNAINAVMDAIAKGKDRILVTMATGTGKTCVAFQVAWKLYETRWNLKAQEAGKSNADREPDPKTLRLPRILFLADRNVLADQAYNAFSGFEQSALCRLDPQNLKKNGNQLPKAQSVYFTIFQTFMCGNAVEQEEDSGEAVYNFQGYAPDFFDFIIIDECHRAGAKNASPWRGILDYFKPAVQLGLTATPKRDENTDSYDYFGEPVYQYSLKAGIEDGFLTPFKVQRLSHDTDTYTYQAQDNILSGEAWLDKEKTYTASDFNRVIVIEEREKKRVQKLLKLLVKDEKTIIFCADQEHAAFIRELINQALGRHDDYCVRVTAEEGARGDNYLRRFQDNESLRPVIVTTSKKLSTGVDARNVRNIVLMRPIRSMIEFKQIIGRGTRIYDNKYFFTVIDFDQACKKFDDPEWDGPALPPDAVQRPENPDGKTGEKPESPEAPIISDPALPEMPKEKIRIRLGNGKIFQKDFVMKTGYWAADGRPVSAQEFIQQLIGDLAKFLPEEKDLRAQWANPKTREKLLKDLAEAGYDEGKLSELQKIIDSEQSDIYDLLAFLRANIPPKTRAERAMRARESLPETEDGKVREFFDHVLRVFEKDGSSALTGKNLEVLIKTIFGSVSEAKPHFEAGIEGMQDSYSHIQTLLFQEELKAPMKILR